jgi:hypothetical protein
LKWFPQTLRGWVAVVFAAVGIGLLPWTIWLTQWLPSHHASVRWDLAWSGFDTGLALAFLVTAVAAWRRLAWVGTAAAVTGTLLESHSDELRVSILTALFGELPLAAFCFWIAFRTHRFLAQIVGEAFARGGSVTSRDGRKEPGQG